MNQLLLNNNKRYEDEESMPTNSHGSVVKKRKYQKHDESYLEFGFKSTEINGEEKPLCLLCMKVLAPEYMLQSKSKRHLEANHKHAVEQFRDFFLES